MWQQRCNCNCNNGGRNVVYVTGSWFGSSHTSDARWLLLCSVGLHVVTCVAQQNPQTTLGSRSRKVVTKAAATTTTSTATTTTATKMHTVKCVGYRRQRMHTHTQQRRSEAGKKFCKTCKKKSIRRATRESHRQQESSWERDFQSLRRRWQRWERERASE